MVERNYMNYNEVFPILDMINRKVDQMNNKGQNYHFESPFLSDRLDTSNWQVESFEVTRDSGNTIDPDVIKQVTIVYRNGAVDTIDLQRGLNPPVGEEVQDHEYINNLMIVEVSISTKYLEYQQEVIARIYRENGYGLFKKVELLYTDDGVNWNEIPEGDEVEDADLEDFYGGGSVTEGYDTDVDEAEDYAGEEYLPEDEVEPPEDGWADGHDPSDPVDVDVTNPVGIVPDEIDN